MTVTPQQLRTRATDAGPLPLWDTSWWITVQATRTEAPLTRIEYTARFTDAADSRPHTGGWDLGGADVDALSGRVVVKCRARPDYDHHVRVQLRVRDALGEASEWATADFPVHGEQHEAAASAVPAAVLPAAGPADERLGAVEVEATDDMTIGQTRAMLQRKARDQGGDDAAGLRLVRSTADQATFAADVVRHRAAVPTPAVVPVPAAVPSERVIGEIIFHETRH